jgi:hypothetical protein
MDMPETDHHASPESWVRINGFFIRRRRTSQFTPPVSGDEYDWVSAERDRI